MVAPQATTACSVYVLDAASEQGALLLSVPLLALPAACCVELDGLLADVLAGDVDDAQSAAVATVGGCAPTPAEIAAALRDLAPTLSDLAAALLATRKAPGSNGATPAHGEPGVCGAQVARASASLLANLADYFGESDMPACAALAASCRAQQQESSHSLAAAEEAGPSPVRTPGAPSTASTPASSSTGNIGANAPAADSPSEASCKAAAAGPRPQPLPPAARARARAPPCDVALSSCIWGFADPRTELRYLRYKGGRATLGTDSLLGLSCATSLVVTVLFRGASWPLWLAIDAVKLFKYGLLLSDARSDLWMHRDRVVSVTRLAVALLLVALMMLGVQKPPLRYPASAGIECQLVVVSCGVLRPVLYQVTLTPWLAAAAAVEALYCALVYAPVCGCAVTWTRSSGGLLLGLTVSLLLDLRSRMKFLQLTHRHAPATCCRDTFLAAAPAACKHAA